MERCSRTRLVIDGGVISGACHRCQPKPARLMPPDLNPTELWLTLAALGLSIAVIGWMVWLERRPRVDLNPRLVPTTPILLVFAFIGLLALVHLANLYGIHTGR